MKQLILNYKELKEKANPDNWSEVFTEDGTKTVFTEDGFAEILEYKDAFGVVWGLIGTVAFFQKELLEVEELLYRYWERNVKKMTHPVKDGSDLSYKPFLIFNEWIKEQQEMLKPLTATNGI